MSIIHIYDNSSKIVFAAYPDGEIKKLNDKGADLYIMGDSYYIQFKLYLDSSGNEITRLYIFSDDTGKIISALIAPNTDLQLGDGDSIAYRLNNNTVILENCGDVCSVVIIKCQD